MTLAILVGCLNDNITKAQIDPFLYYKKELKNHLNLKIKQYVAQTFEEIDVICRAHNSEIVFLLPSWKESLSKELLYKAEKVVRNIKADYPTRKLIFIDPFAQANTNYFSLLPHVDYFIKRQCYKELNNYNKKFIGGSLFTDFLSKNKHFDFSNWDVSSELSKDNLHKIIPGWNLGIAKKFRQSLLKKSIPYFDKTPKKTVDVFCRLSIGDTGSKLWYSQYRTIAVEALNPLVADYRVAKSGKDSSNLVSRRQYNSEIKRSRIVFSPFGWGEACWRDFEAVCNDCLLIKPSMAHIVTEPNIFVEGETYIPVRWDFSDLEEKCRYYLSHPNKADSVIKKAKEKYQDYFKQKHFMKKIKKIIY